MHKKILKLPVHTNPSRQDRIACAPYNFVPLPETVVAAVDGPQDLPDHDVYEPGRHSGYFEVTLTTMAPVYVRAPLTQNQFKQVEKSEDSSKKLWERAANRPDFFYVRKVENPVIPGSTLRGMLRAVLEIASYSKVQWVTDKKLFFRTVGGDSLGKYYGKRMVRDEKEAYQGPDVYVPKVEAGFARRRQNGTWYIETCEVARVEMDLVAETFGCKSASGKPDPYMLYELGGKSAHWRLRNKPNLTPRWQFQHATVYVKVDQPDYHQHGQRRGRSFYLYYPKVPCISTEPNAGKDWKEGRLVLTGNASGKHMAFVFLPVDQPEHIDIPNDPDEKDINKRLLDLFHDDDQITQWQQQAFPDGKPKGAKRVRPGGLRDGEPVFFLREEGKLVFFGRAQMFRLPYRNRPVDLVPEELRDPCVVDYAEALFGYLRTPEDLDRMGLTGYKRPPQGDKRRGYAGRVFVTDAVLEDNQGDVWLVERDAKKVRAGGGAVLLDPVQRALVPKILASPKPTAFQMYLTQQEPDDPKRLDHYDSPPPHDTVLRGSKRYWHQGLNERQNMGLDDIVKHIQEKPGADVKDQDTQHTVMKPVKPSVRFHFRVYFENLNERELGALCWALCPLGEEHKEYYHHVGMGKPLGMGSVKLDVKLYLVDRGARYRRLFADESTTEWATGTMSEDKLERFSKAFEKRILNHLRDTGVLEKPVESLREVPRIRSLLRMMEWPGLRARWDERQRKGNTRYMRIEWILPPDETGRKRTENEYRYRPVLPDPEAVCDGGGYPRTSHSTSASGGGSQGGVAAQARTSHPGLSRSGYMAKRSTSLQTVRLIEEPKRGRARVITQEGQEILCTGIPAYKVADTFVAEVVRVDGRPVRAVFKRWR